MATSRSRPKNDAGRDARTDAGCWSAGLLAISFFLLIGALVSVLNGEMTTTLQALLSAVAIGAGAFWLRRRAHGR